jgi:predicted Zn-dependent peptidase
MSNLARQEMYFKRFFSLDEMLAAIEGVTREEMLTIAREFFDLEQMAVTVLGNLNGFRVTPALLAS